MNKREKLRDTSGEEGSALVIVMATLAVASLIGAALLSITVSEGKSVSRDRGRAQHFYAAESGLEKAVWYLKTPKGAGSGAGKGSSWTTAPPNVSIEDALATEAYHIHEVIRDTSGNVVGEAALISQPAGSNLYDRKITAVGSTTSHGSPRKVLQTEVKVVPGMKLVGTYSLVFAGNNRLRLENLTVSGGLYLKENANLQLNGVTIVGTVTTHAGVQACIAGCSQSTLNGSLYTFAGVQNADRITVTGGAIYENWNGGQHDDTIFPEIDVNDLNSYNRAWYRENSNVFFPANAGTNINAGPATVTFWADADGDILYSWSGGSGPLLDSYGNPFREGIVFVAGDLYVRGTITGRVTFVAGGFGENGDGTWKNDGKVYIGDRTQQGTPDGTDNLRSKTPSAGDAIGLVGWDIRLESIESPDYVRAIIWSKNGFTLNASGGVNYPSKMEFHATFWESKNQLDINGDRRNLELIFDDGLMRDPPPGSMPRSGDGEVTLKKWSEVSPG